MLSGLVTVIICWYYHRVHFLLSDLPRFYMFWMLHMFLECNLPTFAIVNWVVANSLVWLSNFADAMECEDVSFNLDSLLQPAPFKTILDTPINRFYFRAVQCQPGHVFLYAGIQEYGNDLQNVRNSQFPSFGLTEKSRTDYLQCKNYIKKVINIERIYPLSNKNI